MKRLVCFLVCVISLGFCQTHNTIHRIYEFFDSTGWYWQMWHVNANGQIIAQHTVDKNTLLTTEGWSPGPPPWCVWAYNLANWPAPQW